MKREYSLDFLKGMAVITMIITHVVAFFHDFSDPVLHLFSTLGATVSFTAFLFASGAVLPFSLLKDKKVDASKKKTYLLRTLTLLIFYYILGFVAFFRPLILDPLTTFKEILTFDRLSSFSEFLLGFVLFGLLVVWLGEFYVKLKNKAVWILGISLGSYVLAYLLWQLDLKFLPDILKDLLSLLIGQGKRHTFPVLFYMPVFLLGLGWGELLKSKIQNLSDKTNFNISIVALVLGLFVNFIVVVGGLLIISDFSRLNDIFLLSNTRFPPSPRFLLLGFLFIFCVNLIFYGLKILSSKIAFLKLELEKSLILYLGQNAFQFFFWHTFVLFVISYLTSFEITNAFVGLIFTLVLMVFCRILIEAGIKAKDLLVKR